MADDNKKKQNTAETAELTLEEKIYKIKSREITEAEKGMLTLPAFEAACEAVKKVTQETRLISASISVIIQATMFILSRRICS